MSCDLELATRVDPGIHQLITMVTEEELAAAEEHVRACERFVSVTGKLLERLKMEQTKHEVKKQQAMVSTYSYVAMYCRYNRLW